MKIEKTESIWELTCSSYMKSIRAHSDDNWVLNVWINQVRNYQLSGLDIHELRRLGKTFWRAHWIIEGYNLITTQSFKHFD